MRTMISTALALFSVLATCTLDLGCTTTSSQGTTRTVIVDGTEIPAEEHARNLLEAGNKAARDGDYARAKEALGTVTRELADTTSFGPATVSLARLQLDDDDPKGAQATVEKL